MVRKLVDTTIGVCFFSAVFLSEDAAGLVMMFSLAVMLSAAWRRGDSL